jgi:thioredoxin-related protein
MKKIFLLPALFFISINIQAQAKAPTADEVLKTAYKQSAEQHKNVLLLFHASWCGWCKKMDASLNDSACKKFFDDNYVIIHLTVFESGSKKKLENEGSGEILKKYGAFDAGIPFWLLYDKKGNLLGNSYIKSSDGKKSNIGCPASKEEVEAFIKVLKASSSLNEKELAVITSVFRKNDTH